MKISEVNAGLKRRIRLQTWIIVGAGLVLVGAHVALLVDVVR